MLQPSQWGRPASPGGVLGRIGNGLFDYTMLATLSTEKIHEMLESWRVSGRNHQ